MEIIQFSNIINKLTDSEFNSDRTRLKINGDKFGVTYANEEDLFNFSLIFGHMEVNIIREVLEFYNNKHLIPFLEINLNEVVEVGVEDSNTLLLKLIDSDDILITIEEGMI